MRIPHKITFRPDRQVRAILQEQARALGSENLSHILRVLIAAGGTAVGKREAAVAQASYLEGLREGLKQLRTAISEAVSKLVQSHRGES